MRHTVEELRNSISLVIDCCLESGEPPASHVLRRVAGISEEELNEAREEPGYAEEVRRLDEFRTYFWLRKGLDDPRLATFASFNLKQPMNGGFNDKGGNTGVRVKIVMEGVGDNAFG